MVAPVPPPNESDAESAINGGCTNAQVGTNNKATISVEVSGQDEERMATADLKMILRTQEKVGNVTVSVDVFSLLQLIVALFYITMNSNFQCTIKIK